MKEKRKVAKGMKELEEKKGTDRLGRVQFEARQFEARNGKEEA